MAPMNRWCRLVAKISVTPSSVRKLATAAPGCAWIGFDVCEKASVVCSEITSPATASVDSIRRSSPPSIRPISSSQNT